MTAEVYASGRVTCMKLCSSVISELRLMRFMPASELEEVYTVIISQCY